MPLVGDGKSKVVPHGELRSIGFWRIQFSRCVFLLVMRPSRIYLDPNNIRDLPFGHLRAFR
jgi:hypothetical protein